MHPPRDIPGFYYDVEKKKYFKMQPNHIAPQGSKYSKESVQREAENLKVNHKFGVVSILSQRPLTGLKNCCPIYIHFGIKNTSLVLTPALKKSSSNGVTSIYLTVNGRPLVYIEIWDVVPLLMSLLSTILLLNAVTKIGR